ncbi:DNA methyltransferase, partial [Cyanobium sp. A2C-AMD]|uniref:DNA methyltransferase n=1 Tax=Cyanobium sp. A2C-AMD TaxID=2823695 RepID=UPI0020CC8A40
MASIAAHHAEWLSLVDVSGPFLSVPVLKEALPNGLDAHEPHVSAEVRAALEQWADLDGEVLGSVNVAEVHLAFVQFVLQEVLGFDNEVLRWGLDTTSAFKVEVPHVGVLTPDAVLMDGEQAVMLVVVVGPGVRTDEIVPELGTLTPQEGMVEHLKATGLRIGLVTDGERWTLVSYREGENPGFATWWSSLWGEEKITLQAFRTLLHQDRFLTMGSDDTIVGLLDRSSAEQREVTTKLGKQTLQAVEILIRTIDRIDHERGGELLRDVPVTELYDAAVTVMMRLIFLFYAEENDLLPVAEPLYNERYAASTLRERLQAAADEHGEEVLETTHDGWPRLLATWRAVFGGIEHCDMVLAPYGGSLFDPDRYPFLEGRQPDTCWRTDAADPLPIDNRTVLHLLNALQTLNEGGLRRKLSFLSLDVEQIGHVYEGMLEHTAARADGWVLGLSGMGDLEPEVELSTLVSLDDDALLDFLKDQTGRDKKTISSRLERGLDTEEAECLFGMRWAAAFAGDEEACNKARRFAPLIRGNSSTEPTVFQPGSVYVGDSAHRSATGTHYTPRSLTHEIVEHTLARLVYDGPDITENEAEWRLRSSEEILNLSVCDPACGSGAFLVQACRYLSARVVEARVCEGKISEPSEDQLVRARREIAESCLHGADINPMACEMAKLSLWLTTLAIDKPFSFLDHAIKCGDALIGITDLSQVTRFDLRPLGRRSEAQILDIADEVSHIIEKAKRVHEAIIHIQSDS